jgi:hypothetical protein
VLFFLQEFRAGKKEMLAALNSVLAKEASAAEATIKGLVELVETATTCLSPLLAAPTISRWLRPWSTTITARDTLRGLSLFLAWPTSQQIALGKSINSEVADFVEDIQEQKKQLEVSLKQADSASSRLYSKEVAAFEGAISQLKEA